jgi:hypothetical protein
MELAAKLDDYGKPAWITVMVLGFIVFWPIGLAILAYLIWSGRMACWKHGGPGRWHGGRKARWREGMDGWRGRDRHSSGNSAFDEYREETLRRLEDEQQEFMNFLERLRHAKDKAEFDQFMAEQRRHSNGGPDEAKGGNAGGKGDEGPEAQPGA